MLSENGDYKLETDLPKLSTKDIITRRRRLQEIRFKLKEVITLEEEYYELSYKQERTPEEQKRFEELDLKIRDIKKEKEDLIKRAKLIRKSILEFGIGYEEENRMEEKQKKQKQTLEFLHSI